MDRRQFVRIGVAAGAVAGSRNASAAPGASATTAKPGPGGILDAGAREQQRLMEAGKLTSHALTSQYLARQT